MNSKNIAQTKEKSKQDQKGAASFGGRRQLCPRCDRPLPACICEALPDDPIRLDRTAVVVLQHPHELKMKNRSIPILELCLDPSSLGLCVGRKFDKDRLDPKVSGLLHQPRNLPILLFPPCPFEDGKDVHSLAEAKKMVPQNLPEGGKLIIVALDATWKYAKEMHRANLKDQLYPKNVLRVSLQPGDFPEDWVSGRFNIRTTPNKKGESTLGFMSTAECVAWAASELEGSDGIPGLFANLMKPLDLMVAKWNAFVKQPKVRKAKSPRKRSRDDDKES